MNLLEGDPAIFIDENGADMKFTGGQPVMDGGFENAALISLFTKPGWWGNSLQTDENKEIGSDYETVNLAAITLTNLNERKQAADAALKWMLLTGIASEINVDVTNPTSQRVETTIEIKPPGNETNELLLTTNAGNWIAQTLKPAHRQR